MFDLARLEQVTAELEFPFAGDAVRATIFPYRFTPLYRASLRRLSEQGEGEEVADADAQMLADMVQGWDVENGGPWPPTYENLLKTPCVLLARTALEILRCVGRLSVLGDEPESEVCGAG